MYEKIQTDDIGGEQIISNSKRRNSAITQITKYGVPQLQELLFHMYVVDAKYRSVWASCGSQLPYYRNLKRYNNLHNFVFINVNLFHDTM